jgi:hypothetical protein
VAHVDPWTHALDSMGVTVTGLKDGLAARLAVRDEARRAEARALTLTRTRLVAELNADPASGEARRLGKELVDRERAALTAERAFAIAFLGSLPAEARARFKVGGDFTRLVVDPVVKQVDAVGTPFPTAIVTPDAGGALVDPLAAARWRLSAVALPVDEAVEALDAEARDSDLSDAALATLDKRLAAVADAILALQAAQLAELAWLRTVLPVAATRALLDQAPPEDLVEVVGPRVVIASDGLAAAMLGAKDPVAANEASVSANWEVGGAGPAQGAPAP